MTAAELILSRFRGRTDHVAVCDDGVTFHPAKINTPLQPAWLESEHLSGKRCLGFYLLEQNNTCYATAVDFDNHDENPDPHWKAKTEKVYYALCQAGLDPVVEMSQSGKAAHVWLFFEDATEAWIPRAFWRGVSLFLEVALVEVYPRQDKLKDGGLGNLIRYPLWNQSRFVDVESDWATVEPDQALKCRTTSGPDLCLLAYELGMGELRPDVQLAESTDGSGLSQRVASRLSHTTSLLARRWAGDMSGMQDASRSALVMSIATELVRTYVPTTEIENAIRVWCNANGYDKGERSEWVSDTVRKAYDFVLNRTEKKTLSAGTLKSAALEYLSKLQSRQQVHVPSGISEVDNSIDGVGFGEMCIIAARPSHGKSSFALQWVDRAAASGLPCLIISEEMSRTELGHRALLSLSGTDESDWRDKTPLVTNEIEEHYRYRKDIYVVENVNSIDRAEEVINQYCSLYGVRLVVVDYLQLLGTEAASRYEIVTEVSKRLKQTATRNECALIALCQLNRGIEDQKRKWTPHLSDLRESGQLEADADVILFLVWPIRTSNHKPDQDPNEYFVFCAKRRNGAIRNPIVKTTFNPERQSFGNVSRSFRQSHPIESADNYEPDFAEYSSPQTDMGF